MSTPQVKDLFSVRKLVLGLTIMDKAYAISGNDSDRELFHTPVAEALKAGHEIVQFDLSPVFASLDKTTGTGVDLSVVKDALGLGCLKMPFPVCVFFVGYSVYLTIDTNDGPPFMYLLGEIPLPGSPLIPGHAVRMGVDPPADENSKPALRVEVADNTIIDAEEDRGRTDVMAKGLVHVFAMLLDPMTITTSTKRRLGNRQLVYRKQAKNTTIYICRRRTEADYPRDVNGKPRAPTTPHWRRGHYRRLPSGALVPVKPCIVKGGDDMNPIGHKIYKLMQAST